MVYDDVGGWVAARLWWMLDDLGHRAVSVLDGGFPAWLAAGLPTTVDVPAWPAASLTLADHWTNVIDRDGLRARLGEVVLLDARGAPRYRGEVEPIDPIAGHIPTAINAPTDGNLGSDGTFLPADALRVRYGDLGAAGSAEVVASCGSGVSACHDVLAMRLAGLPAPLLYPGSWSDWSTAGYPVATGPEPGEAPGPSAGLGGRRSWSSGVFGGSIMRTQAAWTPRNSRIERMIPSTCNGVRFQPRLRTNSGNSATAVITA